MKKFKKLLLASVVVLYIGSVAVTITLPDIPQAETCGTTGGDNSNNPDPFGPFNDDERH